MSSRPTENLWDVEWHAELDSTMERASCLASEGAPSGAVVVADFQRAGRGTRGRIWSAPPGTCLMFTVLTRPDRSRVDLERVPFMVAQSVANAVQREFGIHCTIKEPNDILVNGRKICGVLCQSRLTGDRLDWLLSGVGLNTRMDASQLPNPSATSLLLESGADLPAHVQLLPVLLDELEWLRG